MASEAESLRQFRRAAPGARSLPVVLLAGFDEAEGRELRRLLEGDGEVHAARTLREARQALENAEVAVLCLGGSLAAAEGRDLAGAADASTLVLLTAVGPNPERFQELIDEDRVFYLSQGALPLADLSDLIRSALSRRRAAAAAEPAAAEPTARMRRALHALQVSRRIAAQPNLASAGEMLRLALGEAVPADRVDCLIYDAAAETLWSRSSGLEPEERHESAAVGLVSFVARTGRPVRLERFRDDPRYEREADDPHGEGEHLLAVPVRGEEKTLAVLSAIRDAGRPPFSAGDQEELELLAATVATPLAQLELEARLDEKARLFDRELREGSSDLFREEAVEHYLSAATREGDWLRISPRWMNATFWLLVALVAAFLVYSLVGTVDEHSSGPAVVRLSGRTEVTASQPGAVVAVAVRPGDPVAAGQPLVRFHSDREAAELARIEHEWELQLVERLRDPSDPAPAQALIALQSQRDLARSRLEERVVRAPRAGVVGDVRCRPEQHVQAGEILLSLATAASRPTLVAVLPGQHRPLLEPGMPLTLELRGYDHAPQRLEIAAVSEEVVGPEEARRVLGPDIAAAVTLSGPVVLVQAPFPAATFEVGGKIYELHDGMWGEAEVRVRSEPLLSALVPGVREVMERWHG